MSLCCIFRAGSNLAHIWLKPSSIRPNRDGSYPIRPNRAHIGQDGDRSRLHCGEYFGQTGLPCRAESCQDLAKAAPIWLDQDMYVVVERSELRPKFGRSRANLVKLRPLQAEVGQIPKKPAESGLSLVDIGPTSVDLGPSVGEVGRNDIPSWAQIGPNSAEIGPVCFVRHRPTSTQRKKSAIWSNSAQCRLALANFVRIRPKSGQAQDNCGQASSERGLREAAEEGAPRNEKRRTGSHQVHTE